MCLVTVADWANEGIKQREDRGRERDGKFKL